jgi:hypothetical protein
MRFLIALSFAFLLAGILPACADKHSVTDSPDEHDQSYKPAFQLPDAGISFHALPAGEYELKSVRYFAESREGKEPKSVVSLTHELPSPGERANDEIYQLHLEMGTIKEDRMVSTLVAIPKIFSDGTTSSTKRLNLFTYNIFPDGKTEVAVSGPAVETDAIKLVTEELPLNDKGIYLSEQSEKDARGNVIRTVNKMVVTVEGDTVVVYHLQTETVDGDYKASNWVMSASTFIRRP